MTTAERERFDQLLALLSLFSLLPLQHQHSTSSIFFHSTRDHPLLSRCVALTASIITPQSFLLGLVVLASAFLYTLGFFVLVLIVLFDGDNTILLWSWAVVEFSIFVTGCVFGYDLQQSLIDDLEQSFLDDLEQCLIDNLEQSLIDDLEKDASNYHGDHSSRGKFFVCLCQQRTLLTSSPERLDWCQPRCSTPRVYIFSAPPETDSCSSSSPGQLQHQDSETV
jgi:hypothetical protein